MTASVKIAAPPYHVQSTAKTSRNGFPYFEHHDAVSLLWSTKWRPPCAAGLYPFFDGNVDDFDPIFDELRRASKDDPDILYRPDDYGAPFLPVAENLVSQAEDQLMRGSATASRDLFLRAAAVCRISRFPVIRSSHGVKAWEMGKAAYEKAGRLLEPPSIAVDIPFAHADVAAGDQAVAIKTYLRMPEGPMPVKGWPVMLFMCGLDAYKTDNTPRTQEHVERGFATLSFEIPGTGDCPAAPNDPTSSDRLMSSILDWVASDASSRGFDVEKVCGRGISTGGYNAFRVAHTHADRMFAVVGQGGGAHFMFNEDWIRAQDQMEYPFALAEALAYKFGYRDGDAKSAVRSYAAEGRKFSLLESGVLERPSCHLLALNGMEDSIFPIEDSVLVAMLGGKKDIVARSDRPHMGNPGGEEIAYAWLDRLVAGRP